MAAAADRFVVIVSANKLVGRIVPPVPLELFEFGLAARLAQLGDLRLRVALHSPDAGINAGFTCKYDDPEELVARLSHTAGVVDHGWSGRRSSATFSSPAASGSNASRCRSVVALTSFTGAGASGTASTLALPRPRSRWCDNQARGEVGEQAVQRVGGRQGRWTVPNRPCAVASTALPLPAARM